MNDYVIYELLKYRREKAQRFRERKAITDQIKGKRGHGVLRRSLIWLRGRFTVQDEHKPVRPAHPVRPTADAMIKEQC